MKETDLAAAVVTYLRDLDWDVHQEVGGAYGSRADIVAVRGALLYVVEVKTTLGLAVLGQAYEWLHQANYVSVAVPWGRRQSPDRLCARRILDAWGVGLLLVSLNGGYDGATTTHVEQDTPPRLCRRVPFERTSRLRGMLCEGTRTYAAAGNAEGKFWSAFKQTCDEVRRAVEQAPGLTTKEVVTAIQHHYSSDATARGALLKWLWLGKIPGVRGEGERPVRWYPKTAAPASREMPLTAGVQNRSQP